MNNAHEIIEDEATEPGCGPITRHQLVSWLHRHDTRDAFFSITANDEKKSDYRTTYAVRILGVRYVVRV
jgi:hypothetical protein